MATQRNASRPRSRSRDVLPKPAGVIHPRVQAAGPEHFGIVSVDCAKARFKWQLADFYGNILIPPTTVEHNRTELDNAIATLRRIAAERGITDLIVAVERTGRYHHIPQRAFAAAGYDVRTVHPHATKHYRQPRDPGVKTDDNDLAAIHAAAVSGFALTEPAVDPFYRTFQLLIRHRRDTVQKAAQLRCQIQEHLEAAWPGYAACFGDLFERPVALSLLALYDSPAALRAAGPDRLAAAVRALGISFHQRSLHKILAWAEQTPAASPAATMHRRIALELEEDRNSKCRQVLALEQEICDALVRTPYVLLLQLPGIHVVSAADLGGEMGPIANYANAKAITGRAGLFPSRYQSDRVDRTGPLVRRANRRLRAAVLMIADNLVKNNAHFGSLTSKWEAAGADGRKTRIKVASKFCRIAFQLVSGRVAFRHPSMHVRHYVLDKLIGFQREHDTPMEQCLRQLQAATEQLPTQSYAAEAKPLAEELERIDSGGRRGPQLLGDVLPMVLARLGVKVVRSSESGENDPR